MSTLLMAMAIFCVYVYSEWGEIYRPYALAELGLILVMLIIAAIVSA